MANAVVGRFSFGESMKRDLELCRKILLAVEADRSPWTISGFDRETISGHVVLLSEAGILKVSNLVDLDGDDFRVDRLTWAGCDFLASARNESVWQSVRGDLRKKSLDVPFSVLAELLRRGVAALFGL